MSLNVLAQLCDDYRESEEKEKKENSGSDGGTGDSTEESDSSKSRPSDGQVASRDVKKHLRMIRNRQSAALSRKRKADRIDSLVQRVVDLEAENRSLSSRLEAMSNRNSNQGNTSSSSSSQDKQRPCDDVHQQEGGNHMYNNDFDESKERNRKSSDEAADESIDNGCQPKTSSSDGDSRDSSSFSKSSSQPKSSLSNSSNQSSSNGSESSGSGGSQKNGNSSNGNSSNGNSSDGSDDGENRKNFNDQDRRREFRSYGSNVSDITTFDNNHMTEGDDSTKECSDDPRSDVDPRSDGNETEAATDSDCKKRRKE